LPSSALWNSSGNGMFCRERRYAPRSAPLGYCNAHTRPGNQCLDFRLFPALSRFLPVGLVSPGGF
jgi:hypothetical protein